MIDYELTEADKAQYDSILASLRQTPPDDLPVADKPLPELAFQLWLRWKCETDLCFFGSEVLGWKRARNKDGSRGRVDPTLHRWLADTLQIEDDLLMLIPRLHLKSTWAQLRIVQLILKNPNVRILLISVTARLVETALRKIVAIMSLPVVREIWPEIPPPGPRHSAWKQCTHNQLIVWRPLVEGSQVEDPQVLAVGMGARIVGLHFDYMFCDDIIDEDTVKTSEQMAKCEEDWAMLQPIIETDAIVYMIGTHYHHNDLYMKIRREEQFASDRMFVRGCRENGQPIYATWFTDKDLERLEKRMGTALFNAQMNNDPMPFTERIFPPPQPVYLALPPEPNFRWMMAIDSAYTVRTTSDQSGIAIGAVDRTNRMYIEEAFGVKMKATELCQLIIDKHLVYNFAMIGIEGVLFDSIATILDVMVQEIEVKLGRSVNLVRDANVLAIKNPVVSKALRISNQLGAMCRQGKCVVRSTQADLLRQMDFFTGHGKEKDDIIDAANMLFSLTPTYAAYYQDREEGNIKTGRTILDLARKKTYSWEKLFVQ